MPCPPTNKKFSSCGCGLITASESFQALSSYLSIYPEKVSPDSIPQISLGSAALIIFAVCAGFVLLRGVTQMIVGSIVLILSGWIGFFVWQQAPALSVDWTGKSIGLITTGLPIGASLISYLGIRKIGKALVRPFRGDSAVERPRSLIGVGFSLLLALIPASLICLAAAGLVHHQGAVAEVRAYSGKSITRPEAAPLEYSQRLKAAIEAALPQAWLKRLDPLADPSRIALAKLIRAQVAPPLKPVIDSRTGKPIPRAIIVEDPALQNLAREGNFGTLLRHPLLTKALADPTIQKLLHNLSL